MQSPAGSPHSSSLLPNNENHEESAVLSKPIGDPADGIQETMEKCNAPDDAETQPAATQKGRKRTKLERYVLRKEERRSNRKTLKMRKRARREAAKASGTPLPPKPRPTVKMADSACKTRVVLDCAYDHMMSFKDVCKLAHQLAHCYSDNRHLQAPVQLYITGLGSAFKDRLGAEVCKPDEKSTLARLEKVDAQNWDAHLKMEDYTELFPASSIVYLCAESPYELPDKFLPPSECVSSDTKCTFASEDVYVIGGLVDHNHHRGFCYEQAQKRGHRTARLPIDRVGVELEGRKVLAILHVFQALASVLSGSIPDWSAALNAALPPRKCKEPKRDRSRVTEAPPTIAPQTKELSSPRHVKG